jgi:hypothetical protein
VYIPFQQLLCQIHKQISNHGSVLQRNRLKPLVSEKKNYARFEVFTEVVTKNNIFLDIMLCSPLKIMLPAGFLFGLLFNHDDEVICSSKTLVDFKGTTWHYITEDGSL